MTETQIQQTLTGEEADYRARPETFLWCETCEEFVLRSDRFDHPHGLSEEYPHELTEEHPPAVTLANGDEVPDECLMDTKMFKVSYHMEFIEEVWVEASDTHDAREIADQVRDYNGEYMQDVHTDVDSWDDPSQASPEYLELFRLLPEDHGVTVEDLERLRGSK